MRKKISVYKHLVSTIYYIKLYDLDLNPEKGFVFSILMQLNLNVGAVTVLNRFLTHLGFSTVRFFLCVLLFGLQKKEKLRFSTICVSGLKAENVLYFLTANQNDGFANIQSVKPCYFILQVFCCFFLKLLFIFVL